MNYSLDWLLKKVEAKGKVKYLFFWGHTQKGQEVDKSCFSQWFPSPFEKDGHRYGSAEHWMMAGKARLFGDEEHLAQILNAKSPAQAKQLGRQVHGFDPKVWDEHKYQLVVEGNVLKFSQNPDMLAYLLGTGTRVLVEASPVDRIWGIGLAQDHRDAENPRNWKGENLLGFALMEARDLLSG